MKKLKRKSFDGLIRTTISEDDIKYYHHLAELVEGVRQEKIIDDPDQLPDYPDVSDEEVDLRVEIYLRAHKDVEVLHRKLINDISFQLNRKVAEGCQSKRLIQFYNESIGRFLNVFVF